MKTNTHIINVVTTNDEQNQVHTINISRLIHELTVLHDFQPADITTKIEYVPEGDEVLIITFHK